MVAYLAFRFFKTIFHVMPFWLLYGISNFFSWLIYKVIRYRRRDVLSNLHRCFPEKNAAEIEICARDFYLNFTDVFFETLKGLSLSREELLKRYAFEWCDFPQQKEQQPKQFVASTGHFANWEWGVLTLSIYLNNHINLGIYKELSNKRMDEYLRKLRGKNNMVLVPTYLTKKVIPRYADKNFALILVGDQNPSNPKKSYWVDFFGQKVSALIGIEMYARQFNVPVYYLKIDRVKRGHYKVSAELLLENPAAFAEGEITAIYMKRVEAHIRENPGQWLWSHRRFKHKPPQEMPQQPMASQP
jgi:KDO2-lipid IV(A) lauroyltransferase